MKRIDGRIFDALRPVQLVPNVNKFAEGSCLIHCGDTQVLCTATVEERVPPHVLFGEGWVTAEYAMLPRANRERTRRDISRLKLAPRSAEIQRLIGRALRSCVDMKLLGERTITIDCDVLQGDGGTRTAAVTGGFVAMALACKRLIKEEVIRQMPITTHVAGISAGIVEGETILDLCYEEDSAAMVDLNCVMNAEGALIEVQATAEGRPFSFEEQRRLLSLCEKGVYQLIKMQKEVLGGL